MLDTTPSKVPTVPTDYRDREVASDKYKVATRARDFPCHPRVSEFSVPVHTPMYYV
jgi:hypothetical protein